MVAGSFALQHCGYDMTHPNRMIAWQSVSPESETPATFHKWGDAQTLQQILALVADDAAVASRRQLADAVEQVVASRALRFQDSSWRCSKH
jgi:hypothetical protein